MSLPWTVAFSWFHSESDGQRESPGRTLHGLGEIVGAPTTSDRDTTYATRSKRCLNDMIIADCCSLVRTKRSLLLHALYKHHGALRGLSRRMQSCQVQLSLPRSMY